MNIIKDFNDYKIIDIKPTYKLTNINASFFISKKIPSESIGIYLNLNKFFVEQYMLEKYDQLQNVMCDFNVITLDSFFKVEVNIKFENLKEFKHLQQIRDYIFLNILGVEGNQVLDNQHCLNLTSYLHSLDLNQELEPVCEISNVMLKKQPINKKGYTEEVINILNSKDKKYIIKKYISSRVEFFNFMFKKNLIVQTKFDNYKSFYDSLFNKISAGFTYEELSLNNVKLQALNKLNTLGYKGQIFSNLNKSYLNSLICNLILKDALDLFFKWEDIVALNNIHWLGDSSVVITENLTKYQLNKFNVFYKQFVDEKLGEYKNEVFKYLISLSKENSISQLLFISNFSHVEGKNIFELLTNLQSELHNISKEDIVGSLRYKTY